MDVAEPEHRPAAGRGAPLAVALVRDPAQLAALLAGERVRMLEALREPDSAAGLARRLGQPRQHINYHLRELERAGLVELVEERRRGNCLERVLRATAYSYLVSPELLGRAAAEPGKGSDRFSPSHLLAVAARTVREVAELEARAEAAGLRIATLALETEVRFASPEAPIRFARELSDALARLLVKYHDAETPGGSCFRVVLCGHPVVAAGDDESQGTGHDA
jgi:DNA-binding transcriptional ArsR family regulator